jgi:hypothetical protein
MSSIADLTNAPSVLVHDGKEYLLREPTLVECGMYQRELESEARASAAAATDLPEEDRRNLLRDVNADIASFRFAWGGEECVRSLRTPQGVAKLFSIVCKDQGLTYRVALDAVNANLLLIARLLRIAEEEGESDPEKKAQLAALLRSVGLPGNFLSNSSSGSPTTPSEAPPTSSPSPNSAEPRSS